MRAKPLLVNLLGVFATCLTAACSDTAPERPAAPNQGSGGLGFGGYGGTFVVPPPLPGGGGAGDPIITPPPATGMDPESCKADAEFKPKIPTVFVLVDRSGSMFRDEPKPWEPLKVAVLSTVKELQDKVRFGFGAFTGEAGETCPMFDRVNADLYNAPAIETLYNSLKEPVKGETPTMRVLALAREALVADTTDGPKYILFVTDGEPDYCGDGNPICPVDGVVYQLQQLYAAGIQTFVFGIQTAMTAIPPSTLQAWANAGAGQPVALLQRAESNQTLQPREIYDQCNHMGDPNTRGWMADYAGSGRAVGEPLGLYGVTGGNAQVFKPDPADQTALAAQIRGVVNNVKSCTFDLQGKIEVNLARAGEGKVQIDGATVPYEPTNGWRMLTPTQLQLEGTACQTWRDTGMKIDFEFKCGVIVVVR